MGLKKIVIKKFFSTISKTYSLKEEKTKITYLFKRNKKSDTLIVVFSAFPRPGMEATYNYMNTLKKIAVNQLFLLDNFGYENRGAFYLIENGKTDLKKYFVKLIEQIKINNNIKKVIFVGSSKGGYSSLNFGFSMGVDYIISGAPMFYLGDYLTDSPIKEPIYKGMIGDMNKEKATIKFNGLLINNIRKAEKLPIVYLHYSDQEHLYKEHVVPLLDSLNKKKIVYNSNIEHYKLHQEVRYYFPSYVVNTIKNILNNME